MLRAANNYPEGVSHNADEPILLGIQQTVAEFSAIVFFSNSKVVFSSDSVFFFCFFCCSCFFFSSSRS